MSRLPLSRLCILLLLCLFSLPTLVFADVYTGQVIGPDGRPVPGTRIRAYTGIVSGEHAPKEAVSDAVGRFTIEYTRPAPVGDAKGAVLPNANLQNLQVVGVAPEGAPYAPGSAVIKPGGENTLKLSRPDVYSGTLRDELGRPLANIRLTTRYLHLAEGDDENVRFIVLPPEIAETLSTRTDAKGAFRLERMPAGGSASVEIDDPFLVLQDGYMSQRVGEPVALRAHRGGTLSGRVVDAQGKPVQGATVVASWADETLLQANQLRGQAQTGTEGNFRIPSLMAGTYTLAMSGYGEESLVAHLVHDVSVVAGQDNTAPDILAITPAWVTGKVVNARTQKPVQGATVMAKKTAISPNAVARTDEDGQFKLPVVPGRHEVTAQPPRQSGSVMEPPVSPSVVIEVGDKAMRSLGVLQIDPGEVLRARMVDENDVPLPGRQIIVGATRGSGAYITGDAEGRFSIEGIKAGVLYLDSNRFRSKEDVWEVVSPQSVTVPTQDEVVVRLRRVQLVVAKGRVLTPEGQPVADARVHFKHEFTPEDRDPNAIGRSWSQQSLRSEADGTIVFKGLKPDSVLTVEKVEKDGYLYASGGKVEKRQGEYHIADIVLRPLSKRLQGVVTDAAGRPVPDALVWSPRLDPRIRSSAAGQFSLPSADTAIEVWAAKGRAVARLSGQGDNNLTLSLREPDVVPERDLTRALPLLREVIAGGKLDRLPAEEIVTALAPLDPVMALEFAPHLRKTIAEVHRRRGAWPREDADGARRAVIQAWSQGHPGASAAEAREVLAMLDEIENASDFIAAATGLGIALAKDEIAKSLLERAAARLDPAPELAPASAVSVAHLAALSATLGSEDADRFFNLAVTVHAREPLLPDLMGQTLAQGPADLVRRFAATLSPEVRASLMNGMPTSTRLIALNYAIPVLAPHDPETAYELLFEAWDLHETAFEGKDRNYNEKWIADATRAVIKAYGPKRPDLMPDLARWVRDPSRRVAMLTLGARYSKPEDARQLLNEAIAETSRPQFMYANPLPVARLAAVAQETDPAFANEIMRGLLDARAGNRLRMSTAEGEVAYYLSAISPEEARALLETEWALAADIKERKEKEAAQPSSNMLSFEDSSLALGMAPLDWERAVAWARALEPESQRYALARLALWALQTREGRTLFPGNQAL